MVCWNCCSPTGKVVAVENLAFPTRRAAGRMRDFPIRWAAAVADQAVVCSNLAVVARMVCPILLVAVDLMGCPIQPVVVPRRYR